MSYSIRVYSEKGRLIESFTHPTGEANAVIDLIGAAMAMRDNPDDACKARVEDDKGSGFWMLIGPKEK